jgi:2-dehydropantoate 2-reductase
LKVCVFGAGAIGGHVAGRLAKGGAELSVVVRGSHLDAIRRDGLRVELPEEVIHCRPAASADPAELGEQDAVVVTVKAPALPSVAAAIAPLLGPHTAVAFVMNGIPWWYFHGHGGAADGRRLPLVDPGDAVWNAIGPERAIGGVVYSPCTVTAPGVIHAEGHRHRIVLGEPDGQRSERAEALGAAMRAGGLDIEVTDRIRHFVWDKLVMNLASGPLVVLGDCSTRHVLAEPAGEAAYRRTLAEAFAIAAGMGWPQQADIEKRIAGSRSLNHVASIVQDLRLGRPMEIDGIYGAPLEMARMAGIATPTLDLLVALTRVRARQAGLYFG